VRDIRSELLLKLAFLDRAGDAAGPLLHAQGNVLDTTVRELRAQARQADGFDRTLLQWRATNAAAARQFVERARRDLDRHA
jgi:PadR family transcriptional regulator AphA